MVGILPIVRTAPYAPTREPPNVALPIDRSVCKCRNAASIRRSAKKSGPSSRLHHEGAVARAVESHRRRVISLAQARQLRCGARLPVGRALTQLLPAE